MICRLSGADVIGADAELGIALKSRSSSAWDGLPALSSPSYPSPGGTDGSSICRDASSMLVKSGAGIGRSKGLPGSCAPCPSSSIDANTSDSEGLNFDDPGDEADRERTAPAGVLLLAGPEASGPPTKNEASASSGSITASLPKSLDLGNAGDRD